MNKFEEFEAVITALPDMVFILTESGRYAGIFGGDAPEFYHDPASLKDLTLFDVLPEEKAQWFLTQIHQTLESDKLLVVEYSLSGDDVSAIDADSGPSGELRFEGRVNPLKSLRYGERAVVWVARNITTRYKLEQQLRYQSETDELSKTFNRRKLFEQLQTAFYLFQQSQQNANFIIFDLDDFKSINDNYGHQVGDMVIKKVTEICHSQLRKTDVIGRIGGDEFAIIQFNNAIETAPAFAKRLNALVNEIKDPKLPEDIAISISIGISQFNTSDHTHQQIFQRADMALYKAKQMGKDSFSLA